MPLFINTIYQFNKPFLDDKNSIIEDYGAFNWGRARQNLQ